MTTLRFSMLKCVNGKFMSFADGVHIPLIVITVLFVIQCPFTLHEIPSRSFILYIGQPEDVIYDFAWLNFLSVCFYASIKEIY